MSELGKGVIINGITGIWSSKGCIPETGESLSLNVEDVESGDGEKFESLIDLIGLEREKKDIGQLADTTLVYEGIVLLPFVESNIENKYYPPIDDTPIEEPIDKCEPCYDPCQAIEDSAKSEADKFATYAGTANQGAYITNPYKNYNQKNAEGTHDKEKFFFSDIEKKYLFKIDPKRINSVLDVPDYTKLSIYEIKDIILNKKNIDERNTIANLLKMMVTFNIPVHLNWLYNKSIPPIVMYIPYFKHVFSKEDLSNIWQGSLPNIGIHPEANTDGTSYQIEHELNEEELFAGYDLTDENLDIKIKIFKVKMRGKTNYLRDVKKELNYEFDIYDERYSWYQYNWPYDFFSLVELIKIEGGEVRDDYTGYSDINLAPLETDTLNNWRNK